MIFDFQNVQRGLLSLCFQYVEFTPAVFLVAALRMGARRAVEFAALSPPDLSFQSSSTASSLILKASYTLEMDAPTSSLSVFVQEPNVGADVMINQLPSVLSLDSLSNTQTMES